MGSLLIRVLTRSISTKGLEKFPNLLFLVIINWLTKYLICHCVTKLGVTLSQLRDGEFFIGFVDLYLVELYEKNIIKVQSSL